MTAVPPRALLFDWDNTLVDTWPAIHHALAATFRAMGQEPWTPEQTRARVRKSARDSFPELFGKRAPEATDIFYRTFEADHLARLKERPGATAMLGRLDAAGYYLAVVSNKRGDLLRKEAQSLGWTAQFVHLVGANDAARDKPAEEPVHMALEGSGIAPGEEVWFVGDTEIDMLCACTAGCVPVLLRKEPPAAGEFGDNSPRHHLPSCGSLADLLTSQRAL
jgi:phosphoglycolate phosphatase